MGLAGTGQHLQAVFFHLSDDGGFQAADGALFAQFCGPGAECLARQARFRAAIAVALVVGNQTGMHRIVGDFLQVARNRGGHAEAFGVGIAAVAADHLGAGHFGDIRCVHFRRRYVIAGVQRLGHGAFVSGLVDLAQLVHAPQDPVASLFATRRVGQGVEA